MAVLFLNGNTNQYSFANAIAAAQVSSTNSGGQGLSDVFVLHSPKSELTLSQVSEWREHLESHGVEPEVFAPFTVDLAKGADALSRAARHLERCVASVDHSAEVYVDLTNGTSLYKGLLSNLSYLLGVKHTFVLDWAQSGERPDLATFWTPEELLAAYLEFPDPSMLDKVAPEWLTEVRRFRQKARDASEHLRTMPGIAEEECQGFEADISNAVRNWFRGERVNDGAALGGAVRHVGRAFEDLARCVLKTMLEKEPKKSLTLHEMLQKISGHLNEAAPEYEPHLLHDVSQLLRSLRNASTHAQTSPEFGRIRARLSAELLFATADYFKILDDQGLLRAARGSNMDKRSVSSITGIGGERYFFGIDGDDTGQYLEGLFQRAARGEDFSEFSAKVVAAMEDAADYVRRSKMEPTIHFCAGDDMLFEGNFDSDVLLEVQHLYERVSGGQTCSIGFGSTAREAYIALKMAKASPGKARVVGVRETTSENPG